MNTSKTLIRPSGRKPLLFLILLLLILLLAVVIASGLGAVRIPPFQIIQILRHRISPQVSAGEWPKGYEQILFAIRFPRVVLALLVGAALGISGATLQGVLQNPLADPYLIGLSSGAALGASIAIVIRKSTAFIGTSLIPIFAFAGGIISLFIVFALSRKKGKMTVTNLILAGVATSAFFSAIVSLLIVLHGERMEEIIFWMMGGLTQATWNSVGTVAIYLIPGSMIILMYARPLNIMLLGDARAHYLGMNVESVKRILLVAATFVTAAAVSVTGLIGFVGLIIPHIFRKILGADHRILLPAAFLGGAILMVMADTLARTVLMPREIPVGVITALTGAPFFLYLLKRES